jgi:microcystin-dependent protein
MPLETATYISDLDSSNPGHTDQLGQADSHMRLIKSVLKATLPNWTSAALTSTQAQIDAAVTAVVTATTAIVAKLGTAALPGISFLGDPNTGIYSPGADQVSITTNGAARVNVKADGSTEIVGPLTADSTVAATGAYTGGTGQLIPIGGSFQWWDDTLPSGNFAWLNGQAISRTTYAALFTILGTKYGVGDGSTTFNLPNTCDNVLVGKATMGGATDPNRINGYATSTLGGQIGEGEHTLTTPEMPSHTHIQDPHHHTITVATATTGDPQSSTRVSGISQGAGTSTTDVTATNQTAGGGGSHNNVQPGLVCNHVMRIL